MERKPRVLLYDIETAPIVATVWGKYEQDIIWTIQDWYMLCFAYKWLDENKTYTVAQTDDPNYKPGSEDDSYVVGKLHELFDEADIVIAHNGNQFDQKKSRARMIINGLAPPSPFKQIDTKVVAKSNFGFTSNKLDDLGTYLGLGNKKQTGGYNLWKSCMIGDMKAWKKMLTYNVQDVVLLEKIYLKLRPWITNHPNMARLSNKPEACPKCHVSGRIQSRGERHTSVGRTHRYQCMACTGWCAARVSIGKNDDVKPTLVNYS